MRALTLGYNEKAIVAGAQTKRLGDAWPVKVFNRPLPGLAWRLDLTCSFLLISKTVSSFSNQCPVY
jgi:hypothetical protein